MATPAQRARAAFQRQQRRRNPTRLIAVPPAGPQPLDATVATVRMDIDDGPLLGAQPLIPPNIMAQLNPFDQVMATPATARNSALNPPGFVDVAGPINVQQLASPPPLTGTVVPSAAEQWYKYKASKKLSPKVLRWAYRHRVKKQVSAAARIRMQAWGKYNAPIMARARQFAESQGRTRVNMQDYIAAGGVPGKKHGPRRARARGSRGVAAAYLS